MLTTVQFPNGVVMTFGHEDAITVPKAPIAMDQPKAAPVANQKPKASPIATASKKPVARKASKKPMARTSKKSDKPTYQEIRRLTAEGRHDEAIVMAEAEGWTHVVDSVNSHRAKHAAPKEQPAKVEPKAPVKPKASVAPKEQPATVKPKASRNRSKAAVAATATRNITAKAVGAKLPKPKASDGTSSKPEGLPEAFSEADLVLHWADLALKGHYDVLRATLEVSKRQFVAASSNGDRAMAVVYNNRKRSLANLIKAA